MIYLEYFGTKNRDARVRKLRKLFTNIKVESLVYELNARRKQYFVRGEVPDQANGRSKVSIFGQTMSFCGQAPILLQP